MSPGDMVRFAMWGDIVDVNDWSTTPKDNISLLIEYDALMKTAVVLHEDSVIEVRGQLVEKAGKNDGLIKNEDS